MENIMDHLRVAQIKKENFHVLFSRQWKDMEQHFELIRNSLIQVENELDLRGKKMVETGTVLEERERELCSKEKQLNLDREEVEKFNQKINVKEKLLNLLEDELEESNTQLDTTKKELGTVRKSMEEHNRELELKERTLRLLKEDLEECSAVLDTKYEQLGSVQILLKELSEVRTIKEQEIEMMQNLVAECDGALAFKNEELREVEISIKNLNGKLELKRAELQEFNLKQRKLREILQLIEDKLKELDLTQQRLDSTKLLTEEYTEELEAKDKKYEEISKSFEECSVKLKLKETELELIEKSLVVKNAKLHLEEKKIDSIQKDREQEEKELNSVQQTLRQCIEDVEVKKDEFNAIQKSIEDRGKELESKEKMLGLIQISIDECSKELVAMKEHKISLQKSISGYCEELESKQKNLASVGNSLEEIYDELASKEVQRNSLDIMCSEYFRQLKEKMMQFNLIKKTLERNLEMLQMKEKQFEHQVGEFELKMKKFDSMEKLLEERQQEVLSKEKQLNSSLPLLENTLQPQVLMHAIQQCCIGGNGIGLQMLLNYHLRNHDFVLLKISESIGMSPDPAKLVLDAMEGFYPPVLNMQGMEFDLSVTRKSCITCLEHLMKMSPHIKPQVTEEAMKLAKEWKAKMNVLHENSLEVLGFLKLVASFHLASAFNVDELRSLLDTITEGKQALELQHAIAIVDFQGPNHMSLHVNIEDSQQPQVIPMCSSSGMFQTATVINEWHSQFPNDHMGEDNLMHDEVLSGLKFSPDPAKLLVNLMQGHFQPCENGIPIFDDCALGNISLILEQLLKVSPKVSPQVKGEASQLAIMWKGGIIMKTENSKEVLAFLIFLAVYKLVSIFREDEIFRIFETVAHYKQAPQICRALGFAERIPDFIPVLIQRNQLLEAARFSCEFGLTSKFAPKYLLKTYLENIWREVKDLSVRETSLEAQCNAIDKEVAAVIAILECVDNYKIESVIARDKMIARIAVLGKRRAKTISESAHRVHLPGHQDVVVASHSVDGQLHGKSKRPRIDASADRP